ncbi:MAG: hypothetical protein CME63_15625 [Halobacteriovoraceae bacterium]|nr:hypothetical protein [Halobacteriovoraceae bacterium]MBC99171.1 hypothetical protein [Halobacteriovoraceae bacterium]
MTQWIAINPITKDCPIETSTAALTGQQEYFGQDQELEFFEKRTFSPNDIVVSPKFGIGKMIGVEHMPGLERSFFTIESMHQKMKNMIPTDSDILIRKVATKGSFNRSLDTIQKKDVKKEYDSRKDRIANYQDRVRSNQVTLGNILAVIKEIQLLKDKGAVERQLMNELLETVSKEYAFVFECEVDEAKKTIKKRILQ